MGQSFFVYLPQEWSCQLYESQWTRPGLSLLTVAQLQVGRHPVPVPWCTASRGFPFHSLRGGAAPRILAREGFASTSDPRPEWHWHPHAFQLSARRVILQVHQEPELQTLLPCYLSPIVCICSASASASPSPGFYHGIASAIPASFFCPYTSAAPTAFPLLKHCDDRCSRAGCRIFRHPDCCALLCSLHFDPVVYH